MKSHNTTVFSVGVFVLKSNYLIFTYLFIPLLIKEYQNTSYIAPLICIPICFILILLLPKKISEVDYQKILNKSFVPKMSYYLVQTISLLLNSLIVAYTIQRMFFYDNGLMLFVVATVLIVIYISCSKVEVIFNSSTFLLIVAILLIVFPVFLATDVKDFTLLRPLYPFKGFEFVLLLYFIFDSISIVFSGAKTKGKMTKWKLSVPIFIMLFFMSLELLNIIIITGDKYLLENEFLGFFTLFIQDTINYIGNLGLFFLYVIPVVGCFKAGYSLRKIKEGFGIGNNFFTNIILSIILIFLIYCGIYFLLIPKVSLYLIFVSTILLFILYVFIILNRSPNYEIRF